jgi:ABC-type glycerol-3-phosphate transport system substrate-binding protein
MKSSVDRRRFLATSAGVVAAPFVRGAHAAGRLSIGFWDHWVPGANNALTALCNEWAAIEKVDLSIDYITSQGFKNLLTIATESQARVGHDILAFPTWQAADQAKNLEPVDDIMAELIKRNGAVNTTVEYLGRVGGHWVAVPATPGSQHKGPCSRIDLMRQYAGLDVRAMYPAGAPPQADSWDLNVFLKAAEACHKAGFPFGIGIGQTADSVDTAGAIFHAFGATLVDANGRITVKSDAVRQAVDYYKRLAQFLPADVAAWDDATNNTWLISGKGAMILNPPSAWAVAKRDAPQVAEQCWTHGMPKGPAGRFLPFLPFFWGVWNFSKNKTAAKSLLVHLSQRSVVEKMVTASKGYDMPSFANLLDFKTWAEEGPPTGTLFHYPNRYGHQIQSVAAFPAPPKIAKQIYSLATMTKMAVKHIQGEPMEKVLSWAESEVEGFMRA